MRLSWEHQSCVATHHLKNVKYLKKKTHPNISDTVLEESEWSIVIPCLSNNARDSVSIIYKGYTKGHIMVLNFVKVISTHLLLRKSVNWLGANYLLTILTDFGVFMEANRDFG